jgi:hypothetical protein
MKRIPWVILVCLFASGCGSVGDVKGTVYYKGAKLKFGTVTATASNGVFQSLISDDGTYEMKGVGAGKTKFSVVCRAPKAVDAVTELAMKSKDPNAPKEKGGRVKMQALQGAADGQSLKNPNLIPEKYGDTSNEFLVYTVTSGSNNYDIRLDP